MKKYLFLLLTLSALLPFASATTVANELLNSDGEPMVGITIRATRFTPTPLVVEAVTDEEGKFSLELEDGDWTIEADPADILNRGYFCAPTIGVGIGGGVILEPSPTWGIFVAIPLRPEISMLMRNQQVILELDFDWMTGLSPLLMRSFRIERSMDLKTWDPLGTVLLSNPPIYLVDPAGQDEDESVYYRAVEASSVQIISLN